MRPVIPQEHLDKLRNTENQKSGISKKQKWSFVFFMLNSSALHQIGMMSGEYYFNKSELPFSYYFLIGAPMLFLAIAIEYLTKNKSLRFNKVLAALITLAMVLVALLIPRPVSV